MTIIPAHDERLPIAAAIAASVLLHAWALVMPRWHVPHPLALPTPLTVELRPQPLPVAPEPQARVVPEEPKGVARPKPESPPQPRQKAAPRADATPPAPDAPPPALAVTAAPTAASPSTSAPASAESRAPAESAERNAAAAPAVGATTPPSLNAAYLRNPPPRYPVSARRNGEAGTVLLRVAVNADGAAVRVDLERSSGSSALDDAAAAAVKNWRFVPARRGGEAVDAVVVIPVVFRLNNGG